MKFALNGGEMHQVAGVGDAVNHFSNWFVGKEIENIYDPIQHVFHEGLANVGHWIILNIPDAMGYITILAGALIIISSMIGKKGMMRTLGWYAGLLILATCILGSV